VRLSLLHRYLAFASVLVLVGTCALEGPIRLYLVRIHAESLLYLRDVLAAVTVLSFFLTSLSLSRVKLGLGALFLALVISALYANTLGTQPRAIAMGLKVFLPVFLGAMFAEYLHKGTRMFLWPAVVGLMLTVAGLQWSALRPTPWAGIDYEAAGIAVEGTRAWMIDGIDRLAGFARSSGDAANLILLFYVITMMARRNWIVWTLATAVSAYGLQLTTMRSAFLGLLIVAAISSLLRIARSGWLIKCGILFTMVLAIAAPWTAQRLLGHAGVRGEGLTSSGSMMMRIQEVWPDMTERFHGASDFALGLGLGNVGVAQKLFNTEHYNPADNMPLYALAVFGASSLLFHALVGGRVIRSSRSHRIEAEALFLAIAGMVYAVGVAMNVFESVPLGLSVGLMFGLGLRSQANDWETDDG
jgi:hypothetical protein